MKYSAHIITLALALFAVGCANRGVGPQGGPKDEIPPKVLKEEPQNGSTNQHSKVINLTFDEIIQLNNVQANVLISPPQAKQAQLKSFSKKVRITFEDDLKDSTTYTIDFGEAIVDNNERNPLRNYTFSFSTGDIIDTLQIAGELFYAQTLNPMSDIYVGIHRNHADSMFSTTTFDRVARTDSLGRFCIRNIHPGSYRLYALGDINRNYKYDLGEGIAWCDTIITPTCSNTNNTVNQLPDSIPTDTAETKRAHIDTTIVNTDSTALLPDNKDKPQRKTVFGPDNIKLLYSNEDLQRHYFMRAIRDQQHFFQLIFATQQDSVPVIKPIGEDTAWVQHSIVQYSTHLDTVTYWLTDSSAIKIDTIRLEMTYMKSDSIFRLQPQTDTINIVYRSLKNNKNNKNRKVSERTPRVEYSANNTGTFDVYTPLTLRFKTPVKEIYADSMHLSMTIDTSEQKIQFRLQPKDDSHMIYYLLPETSTQNINLESGDWFEIWQPATAYTLAIDSGALHDIYGNTVDKKIIKFKTRGLDDYSSVKIILTDFDSTAVIEILDSKDKVIRSLPAKSSGTVFKYLKPESYYMRLYLDSDHNKRWTPASWAQYKQAERVYYFPNKLTLRANWDFEETWDFKAYEYKKPKELQKDQSKIK